MHKAQGPAQFADAQSGFADKLEKYTFARASELNKTFSWNEDNISRFYELNQFLCEKQRLLYRKVESALAASHTALKTDPEFLGGEVEIQGRLMLAPPMMKNTCCRGFLSRYSPQWWSGQTAGPMM